MLKKIWHDPVWSKVIAWAIPGIAGAIGAYFLDWWPTIFQWLHIAFAFAAASTALPNWAIGLLVLLALPIVVLIGALIFQVGRNTPEPISWKHYTCDVFFAIKWRWRYSDNGQIYDLHSFCTACDYQVFPQNMSAYRFVDHIAYRCDSCGKQLAELQEPAGSVESKVERFIQQKIRTNTWPLPQQ